MYTTKLATCSSVIARNSAAGTLHKPALTTLLTLTDCALCLHLQDMKIFKYRYGPQPVELGGQRALDFVLDNLTLQACATCAVYYVGLVGFRVS